MQLHSLILASIESTQSSQAADGSFPAGCNGPWNHAVTPLRNTGHWLISLLKSHEWSGDKDLRAAAARAAVYLLDPVHRPGNASFLHRLAGREDLSNGLIGQAWTIEALLAAGDNLGGEEYFRLARQVFGLHPFESELGLWRKVEISGEVGGIDRTLNHQIWFAAMGCRPVAAGANEFEAPVGRFLALLPQRLVLRRDGLIAHRMWQRLPTESSLQGVLRQVRRSTLSREEEELALGYHAFNLAGLARIQLSLPEARLESLPAVKAALGALVDPRSRRRLRRNRFAYGYNPVGFEMALALETWGGTPGQSPVAWTREQFELAFDWGALRMGRNALDPATAAARIYEATLLPNYSMQLVDGKGGATT